MSADLAISGIFSSILTVDFCTRDILRWPINCKYQNVPHGDPGRPPVTNQSGVLTNINILNSIMPFM